MTALTKTANQAIFVLGAKPSAADFGNLIDSYTDYSSALASYASAPSHFPVFFSMTSAGGGTYVSGGGVVTNLLGQTSTTQTVFGLGGTTIGTRLLHVAATASAQGHIGGGTVGRLVFECATTVAATNQLGVVPTTIAEGSVVGSTYAEFLTFYATAATIPIDDTPPLVGEGTEVMTITHTPASATHVLEVEAQIHIGANITTANGAVACIFQGSESTARSVAGDLNRNSTGMGTISVTHRVTAAGTSPITFKLRAGVDTGSLYINGIQNTSARVYGGLLKTWMKVTEFKKST